MRNYFILFIALILGTSGSLAQTVISNYKPGVTSEGAVYYLPKTAIRIHLLIENQTYTPGQFARYAEHYLRLKGNAERDTLLRKQSTNNQHRQNGNFQHQFFIE